MPTAFQGSKCVRGVEVLEEGFGGIIVTGGALLGAAGGAAGVEEE